MSEQLILTVRPLAPSDSIEEITEILNTSYKKLADLGFRYVASYQDVEITRRRINRGRCFVAERNREMIGTICYYPKENDAKEAWYDRKDVAKFGQFGVRPAFQKLGIGRRMVEFTEKQAKTDGASELALDTAEGATHLIQWYTKMGYRFIQYASWESTNYRSVIMSKNLLNLRQNSRTN